MNAQNMQVIDALNLEAIKVKLMHQASGEGWSQARANAVELEYRRFLYLMKQFPNEQTAPLVDVDTFWHYHILDTMKYAADCEAVFGYFLHHYPYVGMGGEDEAADEAEQAGAGQRMKELYEATFGEDYVRGIHIGAGAGAQAAYCGAPGQAAYCGATRIAYCGAPGQTPAAASKSTYCGATKTAYCGAPGQAPAAKTAYCGAPGQIRANKIAYCGAPGQAPSAKTAYCGAPGQATVAKTAYCGAPGQAPVAKTAYCGAPGQAAAAKTAYCGAPGQIAYCGAPGAQAETVIANAKRGSVSGAASSLALAA